MSEIQGELLFYKGKKEVIIPVDKDDFVIGRSFEADLWFTDDRMVSRKHCRIFKKEGSIFLEDLDSGNGTYVNGKKVEIIAKLSEKDVIKIGSRTMVFLITEKKEAAFNIQDFEEVRCVQCNAYIRLQKKEEGSDSKEYICPECSPKSESRKTVIGNYEIIDKIAQGGMGIVYKAKHRATGIIVALKMMRVAVREDEAAIRRFIREIKLGSRITHPNVVQFLDAGEANGNSYVIMEYIDGVPLQEKLEQGHIYPEIPSETANQLFDAVEAVHNAGMAHRDIKPGNILITDEGTIKLIDLGLLKNISEESLSLLTCEGVGIGTPHYLPPEQLFNARSVDSRADIYSLGATFYHMATGITPVQGKTRKEFFDNIKNFKITHPCRINKEVPKRMGSLIMKSLSKFPEDRYQTVEEFRNTYNTYKEIC